MEYRPDVHFQCGTDGPIGNAALQTIQSTTSENGFMLVDSEYSSGFEANYIVENCWFQTSSPINLNGNDNIGLTFQTFYRMFDAIPGVEHCLVEISTDGVTWPNVNTFEVSEALPGTRFELWPQMYPQEFVNNPTQISFHLSSIASQPGVDQIWLRFRWVGLWGYSWMVDDVSIVELPDNSMSIIEAFVGDVYNGYEYHVMPQSEAEVTPVIMGAVVRNDGALVQNAQVTVTLNNTTYTAQGIVLPGTLDTLWTNEFYLPDNPQLYPVTFELAEDETPLDNLLIENIEITTSIFGQNSDDIFVERTINTNAESALGCIYTFNAPASCHGVEVLFGSNSDIGTLCQAILYEALDGIQSNNLIAASTPFSISQQMLDSSYAGIYVPIPFQSAVEIPSGHICFVEIRRFESSNRVFIMSNPEDSDYSVVAYGPIGPEEATNWYTGLGFTPAVRLSLGPVFCFDENACNYGAPNNCVYPSNQFVDCSGNCLNDSDGDGICDEQEESGCADPSACNYNSPDDCIYPASPYVDCDGICLNDLDENGVCDEQELEGCTNPFACNYQPLAYQDDGSCLFPEPNLDCNGNCIVDLNSDGICEPVIYGCMEASACNYDPNATVNFYCQYSNTLMIQVFNDFNTNGIRDTEGIIEPFIAYSGEVYALGSNSISFIGNVGNATLYDLSPNTTEIYFQPFSEFFTTPFPLNIIPISLPTCDTLEIPVIVEADCYYNFWSNLDNEYNILDCNNGFQVYSSLYNYSTQPMNGTVTFTFDPTLTINPFYTYINTDDNSEAIYSISYPSPGVVIWELTNIPPGFDGNIWSHIPSPGVDYIGDFFSTTIQIQLYCEGNLVLDELWNSQLEVLCAYDPNDIQGDPVGYTDNHFILEDTEIEYRIRFQNTGNAPAQNVRIENLIDIEKLDISTFQPTSASDPMTVTIGNDGMVNFMFNGIMLPDSGANFLESIGSLTYKIRTMPGVSPGDIIENTAGIYFDSNPPIITNTAFHEIYSCDEIPRYNEILEICFDEDFSHEITYPYLESTDWFVNGNFIADVPSFELPIVFGNDTEIEVVMTNPLCQVSSQWTIEELPLPSNEVTVGVGGELTATEGVAWQWYNAGGTIIPDATEQTFGSSIAGDYYAIITGENGCSTQSELFTIVSVDEFDSNTVIAFPNPVFDNLQLQVSQGLMGSAYSVLDITGREVMRGKITSINSIIDFSAQSSGSYIIKVGNANVRIQK